MNPEAKFEAIRQYLNEHDLFCRANSMVLTKITQGYAEAEMTLAQAHYNAGGIVQGGVSFTLSDFAFAGAINSYGKIAVGMNSTLSYIRPAQGSKLFATAREISRTRQTGVYEIQTRDEAGRVITHGQFTAFFTDKLFPAFKSLAEIAE